MEEKMKKYLLALLILVLFITGCGIKEHIYYNIDQYKDGSYEEFIGGDYAKKFLPSYEILENYETIKFCTIDGFKSLSLNAYSQSFTLDICYTKSNFNIYKEEMLSSYNFLDEIIRDSDNDYLMPVTEFDLNQYHCYIVEEDDYTLYPKFFGVIGYNSLTNTIRYYYIYDNSLDLFGSKLEPSIELFKEYIIDNSFDGWI